MSPWWDAFWLGVTVGLDAACVIVAVLFVVLEWVIRGGDDDPTP